MEVSEEYLLDELLGLGWRREMNWELAMPTPWNFDCSDSSLPIDHLDFDHVLGGQGHYSFSGDQFTPPPPPITNIEEEELVGVLEDEIHNLEVQADQANCKMEPTVHSPQLIPIFNTAAATCDFGQKLVSSSKKVSVQGQPSKNLMAERRRRKRLNDRLSMLRSIVPKITKMDRTAIVADTIDYVKELMEKITNLQREIEAWNNPNYKLESIEISRDVKLNEYSVINSPKFNVERKEMESRIVISRCASKPGLLLSTVQTLEDLGLEIQQCVISCFNDFAIQASCSEGRDHRAIMSTEEVKQALFENAGYEGRCL